MQELRRRKQKINKPKEKVPIETQEDTQPVNAVNEALVTTNGTLWTVPYILFSLAVACFLGYRYASFVKLMHENDMWFSEITVSYYINILILILWTAC